MAAVAAIGKKKKGKRKKKRGGFVVNRNTYIRRGASSSKNTEGGGSFISADVLLFSVLGLGVGFLAYDYFMNKKTTTPTTTTPTTTNSFCTIAPELVERRINGGGCGCQKCQQATAFNFSNETI